MLGAKLAKPVVTREATSVRLAFEKIRRISGTVTDVNRKPVPLAPVCANPMSLAATVCDKSKADGTYFVDVTPGLYKMSFDGGPGLRLLSQCWRGNPKPWCRRKHGWTWSRR